MIHICTKNKKLQLPPTPEYTDMKTIGQVLKPDTATQPKPRMLFAELNQDGTVHDLHPFLNRTECRLSTDSLKFRVKAYADMPKDKKVCEGCCQGIVERQKAKENRKLNQAFERTKDLHHAGPKRKNTLGRKQKFNRAQDGFSFD